MKSMNVRVVVSIFLLILCTSLLSGCGIKFVEGSGNVISETREVSGFNKIDLSVPAKLFISQGEGESFDITGDDNLLEMIVTEVNGKVLKVYIDEPFSASLRPTKGIEIKVGVMDIKDISVSGAAEIEAADIHAGELGVSINGAGEVTLENLSATSLNISISGAGEFDVSGFVESQNIKVSGAGEYRAKDLLSQMCKVVISGAGEVVVNVSDFLEVRISGAGEIRYIGDPEIVQKVSGAASIKKLDG